MLCETIIQKFDEMVPNLYNEKDRARGYILSTDRLGKVTHFPFLAMAIGVVTNQFKKFTSLGQVSSLGSEMKHFAKSQGKSAYLIDRRR